MFNIYFKQPISLLLILKSKCVKLPKDTYWTLNKTKDKAIGINFDVLDFDIEDYDKIIHKIKNVIGILEERFNTTNETMAI